MREIHEIQRASGTREWGETTECAISEPTVYGQGEESENIPAWLGRQRESYERQLRGEFLGGRGVLQVARRATLGTRVTSLMYSYFRFSNDEPCVDYVVSRN